MTFLTCFGLMILFCFKALTLSASYVNFKRSESSILTSTPTNEISNLNPKTPSESSNVTIILGVVLGVSSAVAFMSLYVLYRRNQEPRKNTNIGAAPSTNSLDNQSVSNFLQVVEIDESKNATPHSSDRTLGLNGLGCSRSLDRNLPISSMRSLKPKFVDPRLIKSAANLDDSCLSVADRRRVLISTDEITITNPSKELCVPGYLQVNMSNFKTKQSLVVSSKTVILIADILDNELKQREGIDDCVIKYIQSGDTEQFLLEVSLMDFFRDNERFARLVGYSISEMAFVMKNYKLGCLGRWIHTNNKGPQSEYPPYCTQMIHHFAVNIACGLQEMHQAGIIHYDIKPQNCLIDHNKSTGEYSAVITDLGSAQVIDSPSHLVTALKIIDRREATLRYSPPEVVQRFFDKVVTPRNWTADQAKAVDIYSFGMLMNEMLFRQEPYKSITDDDKLIETIVMGIPDTKDSNRMQKILHHPLRKRLYDLAELCTRMNIADRPAISEVCDQLLGF